MMTLLIQWCYGRILPIIYYLDRMDTHTLCWINRFIGILYTSVRDKNALKPLDKSIICLQYIFFLVLIFPSLSSENA